MIIAISGTPGSGKSTVAKALAKELGFTHYSTGDFMRKMAQDRGISLMELTKQAETDSSIDHEIDDMTKKLAGEDDFVIDSRLAFHFLPKAVKVFLKVSPEVAAKRIFGDVQAKRRATETELTSEEKVLDAIKKRMESENERYNHYYNVNYTDEHNYDFVLDTTDLTIEETVQKVLDFVKKP